MHIRGDAANQDIFFGEEGKIMSVGEFVRYYKCSLRT